MPKPGLRLAEVIRYSTIAKEFLKYYWHQICKYKIRQNYNMENIPESFQLMDKMKIVMAEEQITRKCFVEVVPRFQNITDCY